MKYKTLKITERTHKLIKAFCNYRGIKFNQWCETTLLEKYGKEKTNDVASDLSRV